MQITAYAGPAPEKSEVRRSTRPLLINYQGQTYSIRFSELRNLGIDHLEEVLQEAEKQGNNPLPDFNRNCLFCENNENNLERRFETEQEISGAECTYQEREVQIANVFTGEDGRLVRAIESENCAFYDALVTTLATNGALEPYRTDTKFDFLPIDNFNEPGKVSEKDLQRFQVKAPTFIGRLKVLSKKFKKPVN
jgi:hypothetical protein